MADFQWLPALRGYLTIALLGNAVWEAAQLPLYAIATTGTSGEVALAAVHCLAGDVIIATICLVAALLLFADAGWPARNFFAVAVAATFFGLAYTVFSEWLNVEIRRSWAYGELMPRVPPLGTGLAPLAQWLVVPILGFAWVRRAATPPGG